MNSFSKVCTIYSFNLLLIISTCVPVYSQSSKILNRAIAVSSTVNQGHKGVSDIYSSKYNELLYLKNKSEDSSDRRNLKSLEFNGSSRQYLLIDAPCDTDNTPPNAVCSPITVTLDEKKIGNVFASNAILSEGFEGYENGFPIAWPHTSSWFTWNGDQQQSSSVSEGNPYSGTKSLKIGSRVHEDFLFSLGNKSSGKYFLRWKLFIPSGRSFHFNLQNSTNPGEFWNFQFEFRNDYLTQNPLSLGDGNGKLFDFNFEVFPFTYPTDTWFDVYLYFDLDEDFSKVFINKSLVFEGSFPLNLGAINIFSPFETASGFIDDIEFGEPPMVNPLDAGSSDDCYLMGMFSSPASFDCSNTGVNPIVLTVIDLAGNIATCNTVVTVKSKHPPIPVCKTTTIELDNIATYKLRLEDVLDSSVESCVIFTLESISPAYVSCSDTGKSVPVTVTVNDGKGKIETCQATIIAKDISIPIVSCKPFNVQLSEIGTASVNPVDVFLAGSDNCDTVILHSVTPATFSCNNVGANIVTLSVKDKSGNIATCQTLVTVQDLIAPSVHCKPHTLTLQPNGAATLSPLDIYLSHTDNCGDIILVGLNRSDFNCADVNSSQRVTLNVQDYNGNIASCTSLVTVVDNTPPEINCRNIIAQIDVSGIYTLKAGTILDKISDACGISNTILSQTVFTCKEVGHNTVQLIVNDNNGNSSSCKAKVTIIGNPTLDNGTMEICDDIDNNCNGLVDEGFDLDGDGFTTCNGDCNDNPAKGGAAINPVATEICDEADNNCNGLVDEGVTPTWYADLDGDGFGDPAKPILACTKPIGYVSDNSDCNDALFSVNPAFAEICDGLDNDCDGKVDNGIGPTWYADNDSDGFGNPAKPAKACTAPTGYVSNNSDCDDLVASIFPGATEICNSLDDDCDGFVDEGLEKTWYADADMDGYGNPAITAWTCAAPVGYVGNKNDCNDAKATVNPAGVEVCNNIDDDCNGIIDDGISGVTYFGNVSFSSQAQLNAWSLCFSTIQGNLHIMFSTIVDLKALSNIAVVTGNITIQYTQMIDLTGLNFLTWVGGNFTIHDNPKLTSLSGINALTKVGGGLGIYYNGKLSDCCPIYGLLNSGGISGYKVISSNKTGCDSVTQVKTSCVPAMGSPGFMGNATVPSSWVQDVLIYPNPTTGQTYLVFSESFTEGKLDVYDLNGKIIRSQKLDGKSTRLELDLKGATPGIYLTRVILDGRVFTKRLVVE